MASSERTKEQLLGHMREAEDRAATGGHELGPWQPVTRDSLFSHQATCRHCGRMAYVAGNALFARICPEKAG